MYVSPAVVALTVLVFVPEVVCPDFRLASVGWAAGGGTRSGGSREAAARRSRTHYGSIWLLVDALWRCDESIRWTAGRAKDV